MTKKPHIGKVPDVALYSPRETEELLHENGFICESTEIEGEVQMIAAAKGISESIFINSQVPKSTFYYYIDEAGSLANDNDDRFFILSCCISEMPEVIRVGLESLWQTIINEPYFAFDVKRIEKQGFHACENHPDIRTKYYGFLLSQNMRVYSVVIDKSSSAFKDLLSRHSGDEDGIYYELLNVLLEKRIEHHRHDKNILVFEEWGAKSHNHQNKIKTLMSKINERIRNLHHVPEIDINAEVHTKEDILLSTVDYANYVIYQMLKDKPEDRMIKNFNLIEPKIGFLHSIHNKGYYSQKNKINFAEIKGQGVM